MSILFYNSAGADAPKILADGTHSTAYGGYEFAKCIVMGIKQNKLPLAEDIVPDFKDFDPAHPDSAAQLGLAQLFESTSKTTDNSRSGGALSKPGRQLPGAGPL
jgi:hypothetical protein